MKQVYIFDFNRTLYDPDSMELFPNVLSVLRNLKENGSTLVLYGKGGKERAERVILLGISEYFKDIQIVPEKSLNDFKSIKNQYPNSEFIVVGDRVVKEIKYGNQLNMQTIWLKKGKFASETPRDSTEIPSRTIESLAEIRLVA